MAIIDQLGGFLRRVGRRSAAEDDHAQEGSAVRTGRPPETRGPHHTPQGALRRGVLPDFLIIGAMKCGTTSLYNWLGRHQRIAPTNPKEIHFFDSERNYTHRGEGWYRAHFPVDEPERAWITGEATPAYLFDPTSADRIAAMLPDAKLIVLLRDPVTRAESHWNHQHSRGRERDDLHAAILRAMRADAERPHSGASVKRDDYLRRGHYAEQLEYWWSYYDRDRVLVLHSTDMFADPGNTLDRVCEFLSIPEFRPRPELTPSGIGAYGGSRMSEQTRQLLADYYRPHNERLFDLLGTDFDWLR